LTAAKFDRKKAHEAQNQSFLFRAFCASCASSRLKPFPDQYLMKPPRLSLLALIAAALFSTAATAAADTRKKLVMLIAEHEYETATTLPEFAAKHLAKDFRVVTVTGSLAPGQTAFDGINAIADADVLLVSVRRRTPPKAQLDAIRRHIMAGKPVVGIRTASHAFALGRGQTLTEGNADWAQFDAEVIGGNYSNHHGKGPPTRVTLTDPANAAHPILKGVTLPFESDTTLYKNTPLKAGATALLTGTIPNQSPEPIAWTFTRPGGGRTFYTSLGGPNDFKNASFVALLRNGLLWAAQ
jgi:type 1 glutamine amidotransferase